MEPDVKERNGRAQATPAPGHDPREARSGHFRIFFTGFSEKKREKKSGVTAAPDSGSAWSASGVEDEAAYFQADIAWINLAAVDSPQTSLLTAMITGDVRGLRKRPPAVPQAQAGTRQWLPLSLGTYALVANTNAISIGNFRIEKGNDTRPSINGMSGSARMRPGPITEAAEALNRPNPNSGTFERKAFEAAAQASPKTKPERRLQGRDGRAYVVDLPFLHPSRTKAIFLTYESASAIAVMDQGFGRGMFAIDSSGSGDGESEDTLYFGIERL